MFGVGVNGLVGYGTSVSDEVRNRIIAEEMGCRTLHFMSGWGPFVRYSDHESLEN